MTGLVVREDLSARVALSKSEVSTRFYCSIQSFYSRTMPRRWSPTPEMVFGSALDAAVEQILTAERAGLPVSSAKPIEAAAEVALRDETDVDLDEIKDAVFAFCRDIVPMFDWAYCKLQPTLRSEMDGIGLVEGHPDIQLHDNRILDVKATNSNRGKTAEDIWAKPEMQIYAALAEACGTPAPAVGYLVWMRGLKTPKWQVPVTMLDVDADLVNDGLSELHRQVNLRRQFNVMAAKSVDPSEYLDGPRFASKCLDCPWNDVCSIGQRRLRRLSTPEAAAA